MSVQEYPETNTQETSNRLKCLDTSIIYNN